MSEQHDKPIGERVASLETDMERLMGNGQPGLISKLEADLEANRTTIQKLSTKILLIGVALIIAVFSAGSGTASLKTIIETFAK